MTEYKWCAKQQCHCAYAADDGECEFKVCMYLIPIKLERRDGLVRVVRCKDCVWFKTNHTWSGREYKVCVREAYEPMREDEDYCSGGRRRDEDGD